MENLKRIIIAGKTYPIKMDLNVLEHIQNEYGTIYKFERDLLGIEFQKDEEGKQKYNSDGNPIMYRKEPSIKAIKVALPLMINEGLAIEAEERSISWEAVSENEIWRNCDISYELLAKMIHEEFKRCFQVKK